MISKISKGTPVNIVSSIEDTSISANGIYNTYQGNVFEGDTGFIFGSGGRLINVVVEPYYGTIKVRSKRGSSAWSAFTTLYNANF